MTSPLADDYAERATIAAALLDAEGAERAFDRIAAVITAADFHDPRHATLWESIAALRARGEPLDVVTLAAELNTRGRLLTVGGPQYIGELTDVALLPSYTLAHCEAHARIVADHAARRRALRAGDEYTARLRAGEPVEAARAHLDAATERRPAHQAALVGSDMEALAELYERRRSRQEIPLPTPWGAVNDSLAGGLWPGMYVLVGGTGAGKTQWAVQAAVQAALAGASSLYLALELSRVDLAARVVGALAGVPWSELLRGYCHPSHAQRVNDAMNTAHGLPLHVEAGVPFGYGADTLAARAWSLRPSLVVLDYLQLCGGRPGEDARTTVGKVSYVARSIARDLGAVVLVLSSTSRANYAELVNDPNKDPGDLVGLGKESGEIEYAADGVFVLAKGKADAMERTLVVSKNRHGPLGRVGLGWNGTAYTDAPEGA